MGSVAKIDRISVEDYLARELTSPVKHEYVDGLVYAMAGARNVHNLIAGNLFTNLHIQLRKGPCRPYNSDTKIRIRLSSHVRFYYPDVSVICRPNHLTESFQDEPAMIVEVSSQTTRRIDEGEKKDAYFTIPTLNVYMLVNADTANVGIYQRTEQGFVRKDYWGLDSLVSLPELAIEVSLAEVYEGVDWQQVAQEESID